MVGQLNWTATQTRPDMAYTVVELSSKLKNSTMEDLKRINKNFTHLNNNPSHILFLNLSGKLHIETFSDAAFRKVQEQDVRRVVVQVSKVLIYSL
jgi:hypothetical protein